MVSEKLVAIIQEILKLKTFRGNEQFKQAKFYRQYKKALSNVQETSRKINKKLEDLEEFRIR